MRATWVFLLAVGVVSADVGLGYHYKAPSTTYGVPSYPFGGNSGLYNSAYSGSFGSSSLGSSNLGSSNLGSSGFGSSGLGSSSFGSSGFESSTLAPALYSGYQGNVFPTAGVPTTSGFGNNFYQTSSSSGNVVQPLYQYASSSGLGSGYNTQYASSSQYQGEKHEHVQIQQQPAQVFKHFYVHAAPEEPEEVKPRAPIVLPPAQKHYKIIFVKTPTENHRSQAVVPVQPQNEEKTIVYVLVKKPEDQHEVIVPKIEQKPPSKPEVYFIKYKNKEDSQAVINNIVKDYNKGQQVSLVNTGAGENAFSTGSAGFGQTSFQAGPVISDNSFNTASAVLSDSSYNGASAVVGDNSFNTASGFGNVHYDAPIQTNVASGVQSFGSSYSLAPSSSVGDVSEAIVSSSAAPVTVSSTASSIDYDSAAAIATSQGVPHETYGPPKFRVNN